MRNPRKAWFLKRTIRGTTRYVGPYSWLGAQVRALPGFDVVCRHPSMMED